MKCLQDLVLKYIDTNEDDLINLNEIINYINHHNFRKDKNLLYEYLNLISKISDNHHRTDLFFDKLENLIKSVQEDIKKQFQNYNIFNIFYTNKRILLFLFETKIIVPDNELCSIILSDKTMMSEQKYCYYFYPEFIEFNKPYISPQDPINDIFLFKKLRKSGENEKKICQIIRNDSIEEFIAYVNKNNISFESEIELSIFETNQLLNSIHRYSLIEYATFNGSIQIFEYLREHNVKLTPSLWIFAIHSNNPELISILEENQIELPQKYKIEDKNPYLVLYKESIKCHHIEFMNYFKENYLHDENIDSFRPCSKYFNYIGIDLNDFNNKSKMQSIFKNSCGFGFLNIVDIFLKRKLVDINMPISYSKTEFSKFIYEEIYQHEYTNTPLCEAILNQKVEIVQLLLSNSEIDVNLKSTTKITKIMKENNKVDNNKTEKYSPLYYAVDTYNYHIVELLLSHEKIDVNIINESVTIDKHGDQFHEKYSASYKAVCYSDHHLIQTLLLKHPNIDVNIKYYSDEFRIEENIKKDLSHYESAPFSKAVSKNGDYIDIVKLFMENKNIDVNAVTFRTRDNFVETTTYISYNLYFINAIQIICLITVHCILQ